MMRCLLLGVFFWIAHVMGQPIHIGPSTATLACSDISHIPSNVFPCIGTSTQFGYSVACAASVEQSVCNDEHGICVTTSGAPTSFTCKDCGVSFSSDLSFSSSCEFQEGNQLLDMFYGALEPGYFSQVRANEPPRLIPFSKDTTTVVANRNQREFFTQRYTAMMSNYSSDYIPHPKFGIGLKLHDSSAKHKAFVLSNQLLQERAHLGEDYTTFRALWLRSFSRQNNSDFLMGEFKESGGQLLPGEVGLRQTSVGTSATDSNTVSVGLTASLTVDDASQATVTSGVWDSYVHETSYLYGWSNASNLKNVVYLHSSYNILAGGNNPFRSMYFQSPYLNYDQSVLPLLHPIKLNKDLKYKSASVIPMEVQFISDVAYAIYLSNGETELVPVYRSQVDSLQADQLSVPASLMTKSSVQSFASPAMNAAYNSIEGFMTKDHKVVSYYSTVMGNRKTIVYLPKTRKARYWGVNDYGQFGLGATEVGKSFDGTVEMTVTLSGATSAENIVSISIGENHTLILTTLGNVFVAGEAKLSLADCSAIGSATGASYVKITTITQVTQAEAGWDFSIFIADSHKSTYVCGGKSYMSSDSAAGVQVKVSDGWAVVAESNYTKLGAGVFYACVGVQTTSDEKLMDVRCWGAQDTIRYTSGTKSGTDPLANIAICGVLNSDSGFSSPNVINNVEDFSCGNYHVIFSMREKRNPYNQQVNTFPDFLSVFICGSNFEGQLAAVASVQNGIAERAVYPITSFAEAIYSCRAPNEYLYRNNGGSFSGIDLSHINNYQLYETASIQAIENSTFVFVRLKLFNTPRHFISNTSRFTGHYPSSGEYHVVNFMYDAFRHIGTTSASFLNDDTNVWHVNFQSLKGLGLVFVSNQTSSSSWTTYDESDATLPPTSNTTADLRSGDNFFRNWRKLYRNVTTFINGSAVTTLVMASRFIFLANGSIIPLDKLSSSCSPNPAKLIYCDEGTKTVLWGHTSVATPSGYSNILQSQAWAALFVSFSLYNVSQSYNASLPIVPFTELELFNSLHRQANPRVRQYYYCEQAASPMDCSSVQWYESFSPVDDGNSFGKHISPFLSQATGQYIPELTVSSRFGYFLNGIAAISRGQKTSTSIVDAAPAKGIVSLQLYPLQYSAESIQNTNFDQVCIFVKIGQSHYFLQLLSDGLVVRCSRLVNDTVLPTPSPTTPDPNVTTPAPTTPGPPPIASWSMPYANYLKLTNIDVENSLNKEYNRTTKTGVEFDPMNITFALSCCSGVAIKDQLSTQPYVYHTYLYFTNTSIVKMLMQQRNRSNTEDIAAFHDSSTFFQTPMGCDGGFFEPVSPTVPQFDNFQFRFFSNKTVGLDDLVVELKSENDANLPLYRIIIGTGRVRVFRKSWVAVHFNTRTFNPASSDMNYMNVTTPDEEQVSMDVLRPDVSGLDLDVNLYCSGSPFTRGLWYRFLLKYDSPSNRTQLYINDDLVCNGNLLQVGHTKKINGVYFGVRNRKLKVATYFQFSEVGFCFSGDHSPFPCVANGRLMGEVGFSTTVSLSVSSSLTMRPTVTASISQTKSRSFSLTQSPTRTTTSTLSPSFSKTPSISFTRSITFSSNVTTTVTVPSTVTATDTIIRNLYLTLGEIDKEVITAHNIRRNGIQLTLLLGDDVYDTNQDFEKSISSYLEVNSSVSIGTNPSGFLGNFRKLGFLSGRVNVLNRSHMQVQIGPDIFYNSFQDEYISLKLLSPAVATKFPIPSIISFKVVGRGLIQDQRLRVLEGVAGVASLISSVTGAMPSATIHAATLSVLVNFRCFNSEQAPLSYLQHPYRFLIDGSVKFGAWVGGTIMLTAIVLIHFGAVLFYQWRKQCHYLKAQAALAFPSLTLAICALIVPGYLTASLQWGFEEEEIWIFVLLGISMTIFVFIPLIYLVGILYDDAFFAAKFVPAPPEALKQMAVQNPFWSVFVLPGHWVSLDRLFTFHHRMMYCIYWYTQRRKYWFGIELFEAALVSIAAGVTNHHPAVCFAELAVMFLLHVGFVAATAFVHPYHTKFLHYFTLIFVGSQALLLAIKLADIIRGETRFLEDAMYFIFAFLLVTMVTAAIVTLVARVRALRFQRSVLKGVKREGKMQPRAKCGDNLKEKLLPDERDEQGGFSHVLDRLLDIDQATMPLTETRAVEMKAVPEKNERVPIQSLDFTDEDGPDFNTVEQMQGGEGVRHVECKIELPIAETENNEISRTASFASHSLVENHSIHSNEAPPSSEKKKSASPQRTAEAEKARNVWRLLALEEAKDRPVDPIKYDPSFDDDLL